MVADLATNVLVRFKKTKGVVTITSMKPLGMGIRCLAAGARGPRPINITGTVAHRAGGWMHESIRGALRAGKKCLLTSPFIGRSSESEEVLATHRNLKGVRVLYMSENRSLAVLEVLVHLSGTLPD